MFTHYRTRGFILKKIDRGETDQIFTVYTQDFGKLKLLARAVRKIKSKLRGGLELFYLSEIEFIKGKTHKTLTDAVLVENFSNIRKDLKRLIVANKISEVLDNLVKGQESDKEIWELLDETFRRLNNYFMPAPYTQPFFQKELGCSGFHTCPVGSRSDSFGVSCFMIYHYFLWNFLSILGYQPELYNCSLCRKKLIPGIFYFGPEEGGVICQECFRKTKKTKEVRKISPEIVKILRLILKKDWSIFSRIKITLFQQKLLKIISLDYLKYTLAQR